MINLRSICHSTVILIWFIQTQASSNTDSRMSPEGDKHLQFNLQDDTARLRQLEIFFNNKMHQAQPDASNINLAQLNTRATSKELVSADNNLQYIMPISSNSMNSNHQQVTNKHDLKDHQGYSNSNGVLQTRRSDTVTFIDQASDRKSKFTNELKHHVKMPIIEKDRYIKHHMTPFLRKPPLFLDPIASNCISRSTPKTSYCEDHLIKRLGQDATEGRTVIDVGRRVCCALFWHKDCISRIVLETCPDSSPAAADYLMGTSRKLDLTMSCQMFTREGCNTGNPIHSTSDLLIWCLILILIKAIGI